MKYIESFDLFCEARLSDVSKSKDEYINSHLNKEFNKDTTLTNNVDLIKFNEKLKVKWYDKEYHNIIKKIKDRTSFKNISEWNEFFSEIMNNLFETHFDIIHETGEYNISKDIDVCLAITEYNLYLLMSIDFEKLFNAPEVFIVTLLPNKCKDKNELFLEV